MAVTASSLVSLLGAIGTKTMLIQQHEKFDQYANAGFRLNILIGICLCFLQIAFAPFAGHFYGNPVVTHIIMVSTIAYLIRPFGSIHNAILTKKMEFKKITIVHIVEMMLTSIFSAFFAVIGFGVWSFIIPPILVAFVEVAIYWYIESWRPSRGFRIEHWWHMLRFGKNLMFINILWYVQNNVDYLLIGKVLGLKVLGIYTFGFEKSVGLLTQFIGISGTVAYSTFSELKNNPIELKKSFFRYASILSLVATPCIFLLSSIGPEFILGLFGAKWNNAILPFMILTLTTTFRPFGNLCFHLGNAVGRPDLNFKWNLCMSPLNIAAVVIGLQYGIIGISVAMMVVNTIAVPMWTWVCLRMVKWQYTFLVKSVAPALICSILMFFFNIFLRISIFNSMDIPILVKLFLFGTMGFTFYLATLRLFFHDDFRTLLDHIVMILPRSLHSVYSRKKGVTLKTN
ncbi:MAG: lipopolysaccharide biosynthesis protein [Desulfobacterales bacterium]|nr:lipopolysaccharide biosynthesis protein [Desulfobacterales bacterium]